MGSLVGPPFFEAIKATGKTISVQGVDYGATVAGFLQGGEAAGSTQL